MRFENYWVGHFLGGKVGVFSLIHSSHQQYTFLITYYTRKLLFSALRAYTREMNDPLHRFGEGLISGFFCFERGKKLPLQKKLKK